MLFPTNETSLLLSENIHDILVTGEMLYSNEMIADTRDYMYTHTDIQRGSQ